MNNKHKYLKSIRRRRLIHEATKRRIRQRLHEISASRHDPRVEEAYEMFRDLEPRARDDYYPDRKWAEDQVSDMLRDKWGASGYEAREIMEKAKDRFRGLYA